jgi:hypothetical protein
MNGLHEIELIQPTFFQRLMRRRIEENAYRQVNNLVAHSPIFQIYHDGIEAVLRPYGIKLADARERLTTLYVTVLGHFAKNGELTGLDAEHVERLGELCGFSKEYMAQLNEAELAKLKAQSKAGA